ncbi:MAG TPA: flagellar basal-body rod protein FlgF [Bryobacteraceae bacterium]|jgi:flagellar basal-body rod protein FlgF|nr:flagellar basal-body rod protein FlgF [Bryobacteraceae bacterium]
MDNLGIAAASGLQSRMTSLDMLANNLANSNTVGYKSDREVYGTYSSDDAQNGVDGGAGAALPVIQKQWTDFSPGAIESTGNPLDLAIAGKGFFVVAGPKGPLYTRAGHFKVMPNGELANDNGYAVRTPSGGNITIPAGKTIDITREGQVQADGAPIGQIAIVNFKSTAALRKTSGACFENGDPKNQPAPATDASVQQGKLEGSNVPVAYAAMRLVSIMRQFEMLQKAVGISSDMDTKSITEVARVGN